MNKQQINELALRIDAMNGVIDKQDLMKLCDTAGVSFNKTFADVKQLDGKLLNKVIDLAHNNAKRISANAEIEHVEVTKSDEIQIPEWFEKRLQQENEDNHFNRIAGDIMKSRKKGGD